MRQHTHSGCRLAELMEGSDWFPQSPRARGPKFWIEDPGVSTRFFRPRPPGYLKQKALAREAGSQPAEAGETLRDRLQSKI
jgi:hypothetical protein